MTDAELLAALVKAEDPFLRVLGRLGALKLQRGQQYNVNNIELEDYFPFGRTSYVQMVHIKALRMRVNLDGKGYLDSALDLANYTIFAIMAEEKR